MTQGPQCEDGYTKIANEILEALAKTRIPGRARQVLDAVLRKSYGYNRKTALFKPGELSQMTGLIKQNIATELSKLSSMNIITVTQNGYVTNKGYLMEITFNKHYTKWVRSPKKVTSPILVTEVTQKGSSGPVTPIIVKEKRKKLFVVESDEIQLSEYLYEKILSNNPKAKKPDFQSWAKHIDLAMRCDNRTADELRTIIDFCQQDDFWSSNILSTKKLREQFDRLWIKMKKHKDDKEWVI